MPKIKHISEYQLISNDNYQLAEGVCYQSLQKNIWWVDILGKKIFSLETPTSMLFEFELDEKVGFIFPTTIADVYIVGLKSGIKKIKITQQRLEYCETLTTYQNVGNNDRINDGFVDSHGNLFFGTMDDKEIVPVGRLYYYQYGKKLEIIDEGYIVSNGPVISYDKKYLFHNESTKGLIYKFDLQSNGICKNKEVFVQFDPNQDGFPDGMTIDKNNGLWVCHYSGGSVTRFDQKANITDRITLPAINITNCCFYSSNMSKLAITSAKKGLAFDEVGKFDGNIFSCQTSYTGCFGNNFNLS